MPSPPRARYYGDHGTRTDAGLLAGPALPAGGRAVAALARGGGETGAARRRPPPRSHWSRGWPRRAIPASSSTSRRLRQELLVALGSDHSTLGGAAFTVKETWRDWSIGTLRQLCFAPRTERDAVTMLGKWTSQRRSRARRTRCTARHAAEVRGEGRVRIACTHRPGAHRRGTEPVTGVELLSRNGRHGSSVVDTLPLALPR